MKISKKTQILILQLINVGRGAGYEGRKTSSDIQGTAMVWWHKAPQKPKPFAHLDIITETSAHYYSD